jgi:glycosyltransferase involved in cell wall biosynthesis
MLRDPDYQLFVAGSTSGRASASLFAKELQKQTRCIVHVDVAELTTFYDECSVFINPMQRGTGVKLKNIHAIARRVPVVTTSTGNDGSGFFDREHVRVADNAEAFGSAVTELLNDECLRERMAARAYQYLLQHYDSEVNLQRLLTGLLPEDTGSSSAEQSSSWHKRIPMQSSQRSVTY